MNMEPSKEYVRDIPLEEYDEIDMTPSEEYQQQEIEDVDMTPSQDYWKEIEEFDMTPSEEYQQQSIEEFDMTPSPEYQRAYSENEMNMAPKDTDSDDSLGITYEDMQEVEENRGFQR